MSKKKDLKGGIYILSLKILPKANKSEVVGWEGDNLKIRLAAVPEKGEANDELIRFLAKTLRISPSQIQLVYGLRSRHKRAAIKGISEQEILKILEDVLR